MNHVKVLSERNLELYADDASSVFADVSGCVKSLNLEMFLCGRLSIDLCNLFRRFNMCDMQLWQLPRCDLDVCW